MEKEKLREIVTKTIKDVWQSKDSRPPLHLHLQESLTEALHQALNMSGVVKSACECGSQKDYDSKYCTSCNRFNSV